MDDIRIEQIPHQLTWGLRHAVMWPNRPIDYIKLANDHEGLHYGLFVRDELVSVISVFITEKSAQFRKFATLEQEQGKGYGSKLLTQILFDLDQKGTKRVWCNARNDKTPFYERFGLIKTGHTFVKGNILYEIMEKYF